jgi:hypothetical protein
LEARFALPFTDISAMLKPPAETVPEVTVSGPIEAFANAVTPPPEVTFTGLPLVPFSEPPEKKLSEPLAVTVPTSTSLPTRRRLPGPLMARFAEEPETAPVTCS